MANADQFSDDIAFLVCGFYCRKKSIPTFIHSFVVWFEWGDDGDDEKHNNA